MITLLTEHKHLYLCLLTLLQLYKINYFVDVSINCKQYELNQGQSDQGSYNCLIYGLCTFSVVPRSEFLRAMLGPLQHFVEAI